MFQHMKWATVEQAAEKLKTIESDEVLIVSVKMPDKTVQKRSISASQFKKQMWELYNHKKQMLSVSVSNKKDGNVIYSHTSKIEMAEKKPNGGQPWLVQDWNSFKQTRKDALLKILTNQILEDNDAP